MKRALAAWVIKSKDFVLKQSDPVLLLFLLLVLNYRYSLKLVAIAGILLLRPRLTIKRDGVFYFYLGMALLSILQFIIAPGNWYVARAVNVIVACLFWILCLVCYVQVKTSLEANPVSKTFNTLKLLALVNFLVSAFDFARICWITHTINPFSQISPPPYGISSGDLIGGVYGGMHLVNTIISGMLTVFFIYRKNFIWVLLCLIPFLLTGSNLGSLILVAMLLYFIFFKKGAIYKSIALASLAIAALYYIKVTPENQRYMTNVLEKAVSPFVKPKLNKDNTRPAPFYTTRDKREFTKDELIILFLENKKKKFRDSLMPLLSGEQTMVINAYQNYEKKTKETEYRQTDIVFYRKDSLAKAKNNNPFYEYGKLRKFDLDAEPGKITSFRQTFAFMRNSPGQLWFGAGAGTFSSRQAFITSGIVQDSRLLMSLPYDETNAFRENHKAIFKYLMYRDDETHSITNLPFCWYNQMLGEYGLLGLLLFVIFYCGYFLLRIRHYSFGKIIFPAMLVFLLFDYWYERLSVIILFELLMMLDIKLNKEERSETEA